MHCNIMGDCNFMHCQEVFTEVCVFITFSLSRIVTHCV